MCHCYDCRHITGLLAGDFVDLPPLEHDIFNEQEDALPESLSVYQKKGGDVKWYFCQNCGAHILQSATDEKDSSKRRWLFSVGVTYPLLLEDGTKTTTLSFHQFVKHGLDQGGMSQYLPDGLPRYNDLRSTLASAEQSPTQEEQALIQKAISAPTMPLRCHCGHVQLDVHRPSSKPLAENRKGVAVNDGWLWTFCMCHSCRTTSGFDATPFLFAPYTHITGPPGSNHPTDGLKVYSSYPGRRRHFCPTCGACVFFDRSDRGDLCDTFLGLADIPLAAMFSSWVRKAKSLSYHEYANNKQMADCLALGFCPDVDLTLSAADIERAAINDAKYDGTLQV